MTALADGLASLLCASAGTPAAFRTTAWKAAGMPYVVFPQIEFRQYTAVAKVLERSVSDHRARQLAQREDVHFLVDFSCPHPWGVCSRIVPDARRTPAGAAGGERKQAAGVLHERQAAAAGARGAYRQKPGSWQQGKPTVGTRPSGRGSERHL